MGGLFHSVTLCSVTPQISQTTRAFVVYHNCCNLPSNCLHFHVLEGTPWQCRISPAKSPTCSTLSRARSSSTRARIGWRPSLPPHTDGGSPGATSNASG